MNFRITITLLFGSLVLFQCKKDCELITIEPIKGGGRVEVFKCGKKSLEINKEIRYWEKDTIQSIMTWEKGSLIKHITSYYQNGNLEAKWTEINGESEGKINCWYPSGKFKRENFFKQGKRDGKTIEYSESGDTIYVGNFKDGKKEGINKKFHKNGSFLKGNYHNDLLHGKFINKFWAKEHEEFITIFGQLKNGKEIGNWTWIDENQNIIRDVNYENGELNGEAKVYYKNGKLKIKTEYLNDSIHGDYKYWNEAGALKEHIIYRENKVIKTIKEHSAY